MEHSPAFSFNSSHKGNPCSQVNDFGHPLKDSPHPLTRLTSAWTTGTLSKGAGRRCCCCRAGAQDVQQPPPQQRQQAAAAAAASHTKGNTDPPSLSIVLTKGSRALS